MNNITVYGRLGRDAEVKDVNGNRLLELNICQCQKKNEENPMWWKVSFWGDRYSKIEQYLKKGSAVIVNGEMDFPNCYESKTKGPSVNLKIRGNDLKFNPFGTSQQAEKVEYPHEFASNNKTENSDLGDLF